MASDDSDSKPGKPNNRQRLRWPLPWQTAGHAAALLIAILLALTALDEMRARERTLQLVSAAMPPPALHSAEQCTLPTRDQRSAEPARRVRALIMLGAVRSEDGVRDIYADYIAYARTCCATAAADARPAASDAMWWNLYSYSSLQLLAMVLLACGAVGSLIVLLLPRKAEAQALRAICQGLIAGLIVFLAAEGLLPLMTVPAVGIPEHLYPPLAAAMALLLGLAAQALERFWAVAD